MSRPSKNDRVSLHPFALILTVILSMGAILLILHLNQKPSAPEIRPVGAPVSPEVTPLPEATARPQPPPSKIPPPRSSDLILSDSQRGVPGQEPSEWLYFRAPSAEKVQISGAWNGWTEKSPLRQVKPGLWAFHIGGVQVPIGSYEFKFIVDGAWEGGANRVLHFNELGLMAAPPRVEHRLPGG
ncbi:MAG: glycogen-binding domain-containing protein [Kiritimatiellia bacterium]